jgi:GTP cyclohydrolase IA
VEGPVGVGLGRKPGIPAIDSVKAVRDLLAFVGEDPGREGLRDTPRRVLSALSEMTSGYSQDPRQILGRVFDEECDQMVVLRGVSFVSLCEHHMLPFTGTVDLGYVPGCEQEIVVGGAPVVGMVRGLQSKSVRYRTVGLSKLARLVECYARRLQMQERMTRQVGEALKEHLKPEGVGVVVRASHSCMACRGVRKDGAEMVTSYLYGAMRDDAKARGEFLDLCR